MMTPFDQFLLEPAPQPMPTTKPSTTQGELFNRLMLRGLPVMKRDGEDESRATLH